MEVDTVSYSAECLHGMHSACVVENACECGCHAPEPDDEMMYLDADDEDFDYDRELCPECDAAVLEGDSHDSECPYA